MATPPVTTDRFKTPPPVQKPGPSAGQVLLDQNEILEEIREMMRRIETYAEWCCFTARLITFVMIFPVLAGIAVALAMAFSS